MNPSPDGCVTRAEVNSDHGYVLVRHSDRANRQDKSFEMAAIGMATPDKQEILPLCG